MQAASFHLPCTLGCKGRACQASRQVEPERAKGASLVIDGLAGTQGRHRSSGDAKQGSALVGLGAVDGRKHGGAARVEHTVVMAELRAGVERDVGAGADGGAGPGRALAVGGRKLLVQALDVAAVA